MTGNEAPHIAIDSIIVGQRLRVFREQNVLQLVNDLARSGQAHPILLTPHPTLIGAYKLVAGNHRLEAAKRLGWKTIRAEVRTLNDDDAELLEISENYTRVELSYLERAKHLWRRDQILRARGQRATGGRPRKKPADVGGFSAMTTAELAAEAGVSASTAREQLKLMSELATDVVDRLLGSALENDRQQLLILAKSTFDVQRAELTDDVLAGRAKVAGWVFAEMQRWVEDHGTGIAEMDRQCQREYGKSLNELLPEWEYDPDPYRQATVAGFKKLLRAFAKLVVALQEFGIDTSDSPTAETLVRRWGSPG